MPTSAFTSSRVVSGEASGRSATVHVHALVVAVERARLADADLGVGGHAHVVGDDQARGADSDVEVEGHVPGR